MYKDIVSDNLTCPSTVIAASFVDNKYNFKCRNKLEKGWKTDPPYALKSYRIAALLALINSPWIFQILCKVFPQNPVSNFFTYQSLWNDPCPSSHFGVGTFSVTPKWRHFDSQRWKLKMLFSLNFYWFCMAQWSQISIRTKSIAEIWENAPGRVYFTCGLCKCISEGKTIYWIIPWVNAVGQPPMVTSTCLQPAWIMEAK